MGAEVDCIDDTLTGSDPLAKYVEMKTTKVNKNAGDRRTFERFKLLKYYFQSFLVGTPRILVGFRDVDGRCRETEVLETMNLPRMVRQRGYWDPHVGMDFCNKALAWIQQEVTEVDRVYIMRYDARLGEMTIE